MKIFLWTVLTATRQTQIVTRKIRPMSDFKFKLIKVAITNKYKAKSISLFSRFINRKRFTKKFYGLLRSWRKVLSNLYENKVFGDNLLKLQYSRNCRPSICAVMPPSRACYVYSCPWCWARNYTAKTYSRLINMTGCNEDASTYLYERTNTFKYKTHENIVTELRTIKDEVIKRMNNAKARRCFQGGASFTFVRPEPEGFSVITRLIVISRKYIPAFNDFAQISKGDKPSKLAGRFCKYPRAAILDTINFNQQYYEFISAKRVKGRLIAFFGCLNKKRGDSSDRTP